MDFVAAAARRRAPGFLAVALAVGGPLSVGGVALADAPFEVLFIRGAERSGGFLEAGNDASRTEQLADIGNFSTNGGNHGWGELATLLQSNGFAVSQAIEPLLPGDPLSGQTEGGPLNFSNPAGANYVDLSAYDAVVFGSNNAAYGSAAADAVEAYVRGGGGAIFISDANFGDNWADASDSDQPFLDRFGLTMNQDRGTYTITSDEFLAPDHPILDGVNAFDGEGVTPITVDAVLPAGVDVTILAEAEGQVRRNNGTTGGLQGSSSAATDADAALVIATVDAGRIAGHFDRNTFFNQNGAGTWLTRPTDNDGGTTVQLDNDVYALNLFNWVAQVPEPGSAALLAVGLGTLMVRRRG